MRRLLSTVLVRSVRTALTADPTDTGIAAALAVVSLWLRRGGLGPNTLWLDDAWVVAGVRAETWSELSATFATTPGFTILEVVLFALFDRASLAAQAIPFVAGIALAPVAYALVRWMAIGRPSALVGGVIAAVSPVHIIYATRAKQYTLDALVGLIVIVLVIRALDGAPRYARTASIVAVIGMLLSATSAVLTGPVIGTAAIVGWVRDEDRRAWVTAGAATFVTMTAWWLVYLRGSVPQTMYQFWNNAYIDRTELLPDIGHRLSLVVESLLGGGGLAIVAVVIAFVVAVARVPGKGAVLIAPVFIAVVLSTLDRLPLGADRTDVFLLGLVVVLIPLALAEIPTPAASIVAVGSALVIGLAGWIAWDGVAYPNHDVRGFVEAVEAERSDSALVILYPATRVAYPVYSSLDVRIERSDVELNGFETIIEDERVFVLQSRRNNPDRYRQALDQIVGDADDVWLVASHFRDDLDAIVQWADDNGFSMEQRTAPSSRLFHWTR